MTSALLQQVVDGIPADFCDPADGAEAVRRKMAPLHGLPLDAATRVAPTVVAGVPAFWVDRPGRPARAEVLFCHGGAFVSCTAEEYLFYAEILAGQLDARVLVVDYRRAPEHRFPAALDDCAAAYAGLLAQGHDPKRLLLAGDSCGGGLALASLLRARASGLPMPAGLLSLTGWLDLDTTGYAPAYEGRRDPFQDLGWYRNRVADYLGPHGDPHDPFASPARGAMTGLPPLLLQVGEVDLHRQDAERLAAPGVTVDVVAGGVHGVHGLVTLGVPEAVAAWERARSFAGRCLQQDVSTSSSGWGRLLS